MSVIGSNILAGASGQGGGYVIDRSVRLRSSASAYFSRTPGSAGNRKTWTWSGWVKRGLLSGSSSYDLFSTGFSGTQNYFTLQFYQDTLIFDMLSAGPSTALGRKFTTQVFRDVSAWYHIVAVYDSSNATAADRIRLYVNGSRITAFVTSVDPTINGDGWVNTTQEHSIGRFFSGSNHLDGYLTEVNFIDGQALTPSSFGETDVVTGVWKPRRYTGTYGTNGFYLNFSDPSAATAAAIGKDYSGNGNNWTPNNISVTAGVTYDSMIDTPTPVTDVRGNFCVWNPIQKSPNTVASDGNLKAVNSTGGYQSIVGSFGVASGKWYWENTDVTCALGIALSTVNLSSTNEYVPNSGNAWVYVGNGNKQNGGTNTAYGATYTASDVIGVALDLDAGTLTFYKNGTSQGVAFSSLPANTYTPFVILLNIQPNAVANFGQRPFAYTPPSGFKALHTGNLPEPTIVNGSQYFDATIWSGDGTASRTITNSGGFAPDFVWTKTRNVANSHLLYDTLRGPSTSGTSRAMISNDATAETAVNDNSTNGYLSSFLSNGFGVTRGSNDQYVNRSGNTYVAWQWRANGAGVSNTDGTVTTTVSAGLTQGCSVTTFTANGSAVSMGHGLGVIPDMVVLKRRNAADNWYVNHAGFTNRINNWLTLNTNSAITASTTFTGLSSTTVSFGSGLMVNTATYVAYCFAEVPGFSKFGRYTGNGSADGPFVFCGFRPAFVLVKNTSTTGQWVLWDFSRSPFNATSRYLFPNLSNAEDVSGADIDLLSSGFKVRNSSTSANGSGNAFIFMAFAEHPFKNALAR